MDPETRSRPRVAVLIPCYNDGKLVGETLGSIQEREPVEVLVVDDGSDRETLAALSELAAQGVRVIHHDRNRGVSAARMTALHNTSAPYVFPLDADDLAIPGALATMADLLDAHPEAGVCFGEYVEFNGAELVRAVPERLDPYRIAYTNEYPISALFRRDTLERAGGWREIRHGYEDWDVWMTLAENGVVALHAGEGVLTYRRRLGDARMLAAARTHHRKLYRDMRQRHPRLFAEIRRHRRSSDLGVGRKFLYPVVYGGRRRFGFERRIKAWLDRHGIWTLRK